MHVSAARLGAVGSFGLVSDGSSGSISDGGMGVEQQHLWVVGDEWQHEHAVVRVWQRKAGGVLAAYSEGGLEQLQR